MDKIKKDDDWISVEDRLPNPYEEVLCYLWDGCYIIGYYIGFRWILDIERIDSRDITHWQPLPKPPKKEC
ncbi:hypothetical protein RASY3_14665 [Ruminococcus albus SY3]|uniref:DUF551 domain-containing protein n=1 Tax=Ruminococcus albus SY3 TaxID=1341156 RepID=A0A011VQW7_RUMAL|nr:DUF551 domain-containing protein [Ruminococcus albus]EXM37651.1 hypothetical protein RASY3_14665 [Ruminococcus albus SY3]